MLNTTLSLAVLIFYSFFIGLRESFALIDLLPIAFLAVLNVKKLKPMVLKVLKAELFLLFVALSVLLFSGSVALAQLLIVRSFLIVTLAVMLFYDKESFDLFRGFKNLGLGNKFCSLFFFTLKYIEILKEEAKRLSEAHKARGFIPKTALFTYQVYGNMLATLVFKSYIRSETFTQTLRARGFKGEVYSLHTEAFALKEWLFVALLISYLFVWSVS